MSADTPSPDGASPAQPTPTAGPTKPRLFVGPVRLDGMRVGKSAGRIADEVLSHLAALAGAKVDVTLEINVQVPEGVERFVDR